MANGQNMTAEEFTTSVAEAIAAQLKIDASALVTRLVDSLSKGLIKEFTKKGPLLAEKSKPSETSKPTEAPKTAKKEDTKPQKIEIALPKMLETQFSKLDDISKSLNKLIDNTAPTKKEDQLPGLLKRLVDKKPSKEVVSNNKDVKLAESSEKSSFKVIGSSILQKIFDTFKASPQTNKDTQTIQASPTSNSSDLLQKFIGNAKNPFEGSSKIVNDTLENFRKSLKNPFQDMKNPFQGSSKIVNDTLENFRKSLKNPFQDMKNPFEGSSVIIKDTLKGFKDSLKNPFQDMKNPFEGSSKIVNDTLENFRKTLKNPFQDMKNPFQGSSVIIKDTLKGFKDSLKNPFDKFNLKPTQEKVESNKDSSVSTDNKTSEKSFFGIFGNILQKFNSAFKAPSEAKKAPEIIKPLVEIVTKEAPKEVLKPTSAVPPKAEAPKSLLEQKVEAQPVIIAGISESGLKDLSENLPDIIKEGMKDLIENLKEKEEAKKKKEGGGGFEFPGMGIIGGALGVLSTIGGLFTLLYGLQTDGPYKGLAKLVGRGALAIGDALTKPLQNFIKNVGSMLIDIPINMIKSAGEALSKQFKTFSEVATKIGSSKFIAPLKEFAEGIAEKLLSVPLKMLSSFKSSLGDLFGKVGGEAVKTGLGKLSGFLPKFMGGLAKVFSKIPIVGSLINIAFAVSRFKSGDYVGGGLDILSGLAVMIPGIGTGVAIAIDALNAFLDFKAGGIGEGKKGKGAIITDWVGGMVKWVGQKLYKVITFLPIVGPALKSVEALTQGKWLEALKQFAYINPAFEFLGAMLGDESASTTTKAIAKVTGGAMEWVGGISAWIGEKMLDLPIIGPAIKAVQALFAGDFTEALKQFTNINPLVGMLEQFLQTDTGKDVSKKASGGLSKAMDFFSSMKDNILSKVLEFIPETVWGYPLRAKVAELFGIGPKANIPESAPISTGAPSEPAPSVKQVGDAKVKPDGGLIVSSPTEGALFQTSKNDIIEENAPSSKPGSIFQLNKDSGITAGPVTDDTSSPKSSSIASTAANIGNSDKILTQIANNTETTNKSLAGLANGFNVLAKSLEKLGVSVANQSPTVINNVSGGSKGSSPKVSSSQIASAGNSAISSFRSGIEASRFVPA